MSDPPSASEDPGADDDPRRTWFLDHYEDAADQILAFLSGDGLSLEGKRVADVGSGDGIIDLALAQRGAPAELVGFDVRRTDGAHLLEEARTFGVADALPPNLRFEASEAARIPAPDAAFDVVVTWSTFEHVSDPPAMMREISRVLARDGVLFLQLWPFYHSERGSHLWDWFPDGFHHLVTTPEEIAQAIRERPGGTTAWADYMLREFRDLNRVTVDDLHDAIVGAGLRVRKLELLSNTVHLPDADVRVRLTDLGVAGIKLLATPAGR